MRSVRGGAALLAVAVSVAAASYAARALMGEGEVDPGPPRSVAEVDRGPAGLDPAPAPSQIGEIERLIRAYERRTRDRPDALEYRFLGRLHFERGRLTGDVASYGLAEEALSKAMELYPTDAEAGILLATVRYTVHDFPGALELAQQVLAVDPGQRAALGVAGDAYLELGRYEAAEEAYGDLALALPGAGAVDARLARAAFLRGEGEEARRLARKAEAEARDEGAFGAGLAWYRILRAHLELDAGRYGEAARLSGSALAIAPGYHVALASLARARAAEGRIADAVRLYRRAIAAVPQPEYLAALGDLQVLLGQRRQANRQYETVEAIATLARVNRQVYNRQLVLFYADHDLKPGLALRLAEAELEVRRDVYGYDAYAWALYRSARYAEARAASDRALRLGTPDARLWYHAGLISSALGEKARARAELERALALSPAFDPLQAPRARAALAELTGGAT